MIAKLGADPAIEAIAATDILPVAGASAFHLNLGNLPVAAGSEPMALRIVTRQYFHAMGMRLIEGRTFEAGAVPYAEVILSEEFARRYFPNSSPLGQILTAGQARYQVVGVVNDARQSGLNAKLRAEYYVDLTRFGLTTATRPHFVVRTAADTSHIGPLIRSTVQNIDPLLGVDLNQEAAGTSRYLESMLFELTPLDPWTFLAVAAMALVLAVLAAYPPAARASRVDPVIALRS